jgi:hypothetical protein|tara:strand:- start:2574 stop:2780 length:207 start_codon:yes stop_codon:yes gene_type:complete
MTFKIEKNIPMSVTPSTAKFLVLNDMAEGDSFILTYGETLAARRAAWKWKHKIIIRKISDSSYRLWKL